VISHNSQKTLFLISNLLLEPSLTIPGFLSIISIIGKPKGEKIIFLLGITLFRGEKPYKKQVFKPLGLERRPNGCFATNRIDPQCFDRRMGTGCGTKRPCDREKRGGDY
jgi:hypothetical protein